MNHAGIRSALSRIAWAYLLIHLHFRLNNLDLLPDWAGYLLIFSAIGLLAGELRDLPLRELSGAEIRARMNENGARLD